MKNITAQILHLADLVEYQSDSIVSKELIKKSTGNITLFAFDAGQRLNEHTAPFEAFVYILDGKAEINISGKSFTPEAGESIIMPANEPHAVKALKRFKMMLVMIKS